MFNTNREVNITSISERLPAVLVSGLVVGAGARGFRLGYVIVTILVFSAGIFIGWFFGS